MPRRAATRTKLAADVTAANAGRVAATSKESEIADRNGLVAQDHVRVLDASLVITDCTSVDEHLRIAETLWQASGARGTELALPHYEAAAALAKEAGDERKACMIALGHGYALKHLGRQAAARALLRKAKRIAEKQDNDAAVAFVNQIFQTEISQQDVGEKEICEMWQGFATHKSSSYSVSLFLRGTPMHSRDAASWEAVQKMRAIGVESVYVVDVSCPGVDFPPGLLKIAKSPHVSFPQLFVHGREVRNVLHLHDDELREMLHTAGVAMRSPQQVERNPPSFDVQSEAERNICFSGKDTRRSSTKSRKGKKKKSKVSIKQSTEFEDQSAAKEFAVEDDIGLPGSDQSDFKTSILDHVHVPLIACVVPDQTLMCEDGGAVKSAEANDTEEIEECDEADGTEATQRDDAGEPTGNTAEAVGCEDATTSSSELSTADVVALEADDTVGVDDAMDADGASCSSSASEESRSHAAWSTDCTSDESRGQAGCCPSSASSDAGADTSADVDGSGIDCIGFAPRSPCGADDTASAVTPAPALVLPPLSHFLADRFPSPSAGLTPPPPPPGLGMPDAPCCPSFRPPPGIPGPAFEDLCWEDGFNSMTSLAVLAEENKLLRQLLAQQAGDLAFMRHMVSGMAQARDSAPEPELGWPGL